MKRVLCTVLLIASLIFSLWIPQFSYAQTEIPSSEQPLSSDGAKKLTKIASPERTVATYGNGASASALLDGNKTSGYQLIPLGESCHATFYFGNPHYVSRVCVFTYSENYTFRVLTSMNGVDYTPVAENEIGVQYSTDTGYVIDFDGRECQYLRVEGISGQFGYFSLYEIEIYADFTDSNPLTEVSHPNNTTATLANGNRTSLLTDGKYTGAYQMIPLAENCSVQLDLGAAYAVRKICVYTYNANYRFRIEASLDGITYIPLGENVYDAQYDANQGYRLTVTAGNYRYIRLVGLSGQYGYFSLYELDVFADLTPPLIRPTEKLYEVSLPEYAVAQTANGSYEPLLIDGSLQKYRMIPEGDNCYVTLELDKAYTVQKVTVYTYSAGYGFTLEGSLDGVEYVPLGANDLSQSYDPKVGYTVEIASGDYQYLRVRGAVCPYGYFSLYEIDVYATMPPPRRGDLDGNYTVNIADLNLMLVALSTGMDLPVADLDGNNLLNVADLNELLIILSTQA